VLNQAYTALQAEYIKLKTEQELAAAAQYHQQLGLGFDPTMGGTSTVQVDGFDSELYLCENGPVYPI
jgi:hypothetical protein